MHSTHAEKLLKLLQSMEQLGFESIGVWLNDSVGRDTMYIEIKVKMELMESKPKKKELKQKI